MSTKSLCLERAQKYADSRLQGLLSEHLTLKDRWIYISKILEYGDILPDIFIEGGINQVIGFYSSYGLGKLRLMKKEGQLPKPSIYKLQNSLHEVKKSIGTIARILALLKTGFYQRTDAIDIPYVIANIPFSPERSWGNELYLVAADKLVKNYLKFLNTHGKKWDHCVSYAPFYPRPLLSEPPGGIQLSFHKTFHLQLSEEAKYNLQSFVILAHEIGEAACCTLFKKISGQKIFTPTYRFLWLFYNLVEQMLKILNTCVEQENVYLSQCILQKLGYVFQKDSKGKPKNSRRKFIAEISKSSFGGYIDQVLADVVAMILAGSNYISSLCDYVYDSVLLGEKKTQVPSVNIPALFDMIFRIACCDAFAQIKLPKKFRLESSKTLKHVTKETRLAITEVQRKKVVQRKDIASLRNCVDCINNLGWLFGTFMAASSDKIFEDILISKGVVFETDETVVRQLRAEKIVTSREPRVILDAYLKLIASRQKLTCPAALYSIALSPT